jgi:hypothetical protein
VSDSDTPERPKKHNRKPPAPPKGVFGGGAHNIYRGGKGATPAPPKHDKAKWWSDDLPAELADMRYIYYGSSEKKTETQGQRALRKLLADNPQKFLDRYDELERQYAASKPKTEGETGSPESPAVAPPSDETAERVAARIEVWLDQHRAKALADFPG